MFVVNNFFGSAAQVLDMALGLYMWVIVVSALISWVSPDPYNPVVRFLRAVTEPVLRPVRRVLPIMGGVDFSPLVVILGIVFLRGFLVRSLMDMARRM